MASGSLNRCGSARCCRRRDFAFDRRRFGEHCLRHIFGGYKQEIRAVNDVERKGTKGYPPENFNRSSRTVTSVLSNTPFASDISRRHRCENPTSSLDIDRSCSTLSCRHHLVVAHHKTCSCSQHCFLTTPGTFHNTHLSANNTNIHHEISICHLVLDCRGTCRILCQSTPIRWVLCAMSSCGDTHRSTTISSHSTANG